MTRDISFATLNLYNLQVAGAPWRGNAYRPEEYEAKIDWTAGMLTEIAADVTGFQELWSEQALRDAFERAGRRQEHELAFIKDPGGDWYDIAVAAAVRRPWTIKARRVHKRFPDSVLLRKRGWGRHDNPEDDEIDVAIEVFSRSVLDLLIGHPDDALPDVRVFVVHLKSKLPTRLDREERERDEVQAQAGALGAAISTIRRTAEAAALRVILNEAIKDTTTPVVVLGDFNDSKNSNTLAIVSDQPPHRLFASSRVAFKSDAGLYSTQALQEFRSTRDVYFTHVFQGVRDSLDHVLVSEQFYDHSRNRVWSFRDMRVWNDYLDEHAEDPRFQEEFRRTSDHAAVRAAFVHDPAD